MLSFFEAVGNYWYGQSVSEPVCQQDSSPEDIDDNWVYVESEIEKILLERTFLEKQNRNKEITSIQTVTKPAKNSAYWTSYFDSVLKNHPKFGTPEFSIDLPHSMRSSIMQKFIREKSLFWSEILKYFHDLYITESFDTEKWTDFQCSFIRIPKFGGKGKEGAIIDFALMSYGGVLSGKILSRILLSWSQTLRSFLNADFNLTLSPAEIELLETKLSDNVLDIIEMHLTVCSQSHVATTKLGSLQSKWSSERKEVTIIDAKYVREEKISVLESKKPKESMFEIQKKLLQSFARGTPVKRQVEEIPENEKILLPAFYDAKVRLQMNLEKRFRHQTKILQSAVGNPFKRQVEEIPENEKILLPAFNEAKFRLQVNLEKSNRIHH